jgi:hypothetical protein
VHSYFSNADLQKVLANKIKRVQTCLDARGHHFQHLLYVHSDFPNALYKSTWEIFTFCIFSDSFSGSDCVRLSVRIRGK